MSFRSFYLLLVVQAVAAFNTVPIEKFSRPLDRRRPLYASQRGEDGPKKSGWDSFKSAVYGGVDSISDLASKLSGGTENDAERVEDGYSDFEESIRFAPGKKIMSEYQARADALGAESDSTSGSETSGFDAFKKGVYNALDSSSEIFKEPAPPKPILDRNVPYKRSLAQDLSNEDLISSNPIKRFQAEMEVREREAQDRAILRNEDIKAKKRDLYDFIDSVQATVDSLPEKYNQAEKAAKDAVNFVQSVPDRVDKTVAEVKAIPSKVQQKATETKESVDETIETTKNFVEDVKDIPNKVTKKFEDTKRQVEETKESVDETVTGFKVLVGLEKPKPKPPKLPPPKDPTLKSVALDVAGGVAKGAGNLAWWATKSTANLAWSSAKSAFDKATSSEGGQPALQAADTQTETNASAPPPPSSAKEVTDPVEIPETTVVLPETPVDTKEVEQEVADALKLAEASLRKASVNKNKKNGN